MGFVPTKSLGFILALLLIISFTVLGQNDAGIVTSELAPHSSVSSPPVEAPKPHKGGHHHHKHHPQPPASPPSHSSPPPVKPPTPPAHSPSKPPSPPVKPPTSPAHSPKKPPSPPAKPSTPPAHSPKKPPYPPVKPPTPPAHSPSKPPSPPVKPPTPPAHPPVKPPSPLPTRQFVGVRGVVYCKSCKYRGVETLLGAYPIQGAVVRLACNNTKYHLISLGTTDKNGFFYIQPKWLTTAGYHKCKVFLAKSPKAECSVPTNFHNGKSGAMLIPAPPSSMTSSKPAEFGVKLFNVGPFAYEPSKNLPCKTM